MPYVATGPGVRDLYWKKVLCMTNLDSWVPETVIKGLILLFRNDASTQIWVRMIEWNLAPP